MRISSFLSFFFSFHHFSLFSVVFHCFFNVFHCFALFFIVFNHPKFISIQNWNSYFRPLQLKSRLFTAQNFVCSTPSVPKSLVFIRATHIYEYLRKNTRILLVFLWFTRIFCDLGHILRVVSCLSQLNRIWFTHFCRKNVASRIYALF